MPRDEIAYQINVWLVGVRFERQRIMTAQINRMTARAERMRALLNRADHLGQRAEQVMDHADSVMNNFESGINTAEASTAELEQVVTTLGNFPPLEIDSPTPQKASPVAQTQPQATGQPISVLNAPALNPAPPRTIGFPNSSLIRHGT